MFNKLLQDSRFQGSPYKYKEVQASKFFTER